MCYAWRSFPPLPPRILSYISANARAGDSFLSCVLSRAHKSLEERDAASGLALHSGALAFSRSRVSQFTTGRFASPHYHKSLQVLQVLPPSLTSPLLTTSTLYRRVTRRSPRRRRHFRSMSTAFKPSCDWSPFCHRSRLALTLLLHQTTCRAKTKCFTAAETSRPACPSRATAII